MKNIIDVSQHNGIINFEKVKQDNIEGIIIRVGWLGNKNNHTLDSRFEENYKKARESGLKIGFYVYSYCTSTITLKSGINWLIKQIKSKSFDLPVFLDLEDSSISLLSNYTLTLQARMFCEIIEQYNWKAGVYASKYWFMNKLDINQLLNYKIWLAEWNGKQNHTLPYKVDLWQYTSSGKVKGITGRVDMNYCLCECGENVENSVDKIR